MVLYAGRIVDAGYTNDVFAPPRHPCTQRPVNFVPALRQGRLEEVITGREAEAGMRSSVMLHGHTCPFRMHCPRVISGTRDRETAPARETGYVAHRHVPARRGDPPRGAGWTEPYRSSGGLVAASP